MRKFSRTASSPITSSPATPDARPGWERPGAAKMPSTRGRRFPRENPATRRPTLPGRPQDSAVVPAAVQDSALG